MRCEIFRTEVNDTSTKELPNEWAKLHARYLPIEIIGLKVETGATCDAVQTWMWHNLRSTFQSTGGFTRRTSYAEATRNPSKVRKLFFLFFFFFFFWDYRRISNGRDVNEFGAIVCSIDVFTRVGTRWIYNSRSFLSIVSQKCEYRFIFHFCFYNTVSP